ncbi:MAG: YncE family protein, partial [Candidatus Sericytochromatia bacterium]
MSKVNELIQDMLPYQGTRCEVDLAACELRLQAADGTEHRLELPAAQRVPAPQLHSWGQGICLLDPQTGAQQRLAPWDPGLTYGLALAEGGPFLLCSEDRFAPRLIQSRQLVYPGFYARRPAQGPFDLFTSQDQRLLAVVNRGEAHVLVVDPASGQELGRQQFKHLTGPKMVSVSLDSERRQAWICGPGDRRVCRWDLDSNQVEVVSGNWRHAVAAVVQDGTLWLLDSHQQTFVHALALPDLKPVQRLSIEGGSYAQQTDTPGDLLMLDPGGKWLAVMTHVNMPIPLTPKLTVIQLNNRKGDREYQPSTRTWPVMLATTRPNRALRALQARHALNRELEQLIPTGYVKAVLESQRMSLANFESSLVVFDAKPGPQMDLSAELRELVGERIFEALKQEHGILMTLPASSPLESEVLVQAGRLAQLLQQHEALDVALLRLLGCYHLEMQFQRAELLSQLSAREIDQLDELRAAVVVEKPVFRWAHGSGLSSGWAGLADPLNSRIFKLNPKLEMSWSLDTTSMGVYRPVDVCWLSDQGFLVLDGDRSRVSAWSLLGKQEWALESEDDDWNRVLYYELGNDAGLLLLDSQQGRLLHGDCRSGKLTTLPDLDDQALDICTAEAESFWLLHKQGQFGRYGLDGKQLESVKLEGHPSRMALSPDGSILALFDGQVQKLWLRREGEVSSHSLVMPSTRYRISEPVGMQWRNDSEIVLHDSFRVLVIDTANGELLHHCLIQDLKLPAGQHNLAPEAIFTAQAERNL